MLQAPFLRACCGIASVQYNYKTNNRFAYKQGNHALLTRLTSDLEYFPKQLTLGSSLPDDILAQPRSQALPFASTTREENEREPGNEVAFIIFPMIGLNDWVVQSYRRYAPFTLYV